MHARAVEFVYTSSLELFWRYHLSAMDVVRGEIANKRCMCDNEESFIIAWKLGYATR
jgi:hypothetical protein